MILFQIFTLTPKFIVILPLIRVISISNRMVWSAINDKFNEW